MELVSLGSVDVFGPADDDASAADVVSRPGVERGDMSVDGPPGRPSGSAEC